MLKVGLTGGIAVGKSTVVAELARHGAVCFDADRIAREVVEPGKPAYHAVIDEFGRAAVAPDGTLDRAAIGQIVFANPERRKKLESILHPAIISEQNRLVAETMARDPGTVVIVDAALMIESGSYKRFDALVVVHCDSEVQIERLMARDELTREEAMRRIASQMSQHEKLEYADYTVDTSGTVEETLSRARDLWDALKTRSAEGLGKC